MNLLHPGETLSLWLDKSDMPKFSKLYEDLYVDVCVIGGGIGGLTTAYLLMKEGKKVAVLESFELASGQTGKTTAHFSNALDARYFELEKYHGQSGAKLAAESHTAAINTVEKIIKELNTDCDFERIDGYLFSQGDVREVVLQKELEAAHRSGLNVQFVKTSPITTFDTGPCLKFVNQAQLDPIKYLSSITKAFVDGGGQIYTHTQVIEVNTGAIAEVKTSDGFRVRSDSLVVATNTPINDLFAIHTKQAAFRTYVIGFKIPKGGVPKGLYWDTLEPYHYVRVDSGETEDTLIVGGEDHKTGQEDHPELCFTHLEKWARERFKNIIGIGYRWSGQVMKPVDGLAFLGHNPLDRENIYVITGDSGNGMTHCTIGALLITDQIMNRKNAWEALYNPSRISLRATAEFLKQNSNVAAQYRDWFSSAPKPDVHALRRGEGIVFRDGLRMIATYKNTTGAIEFMSAACTHLGGVVHWNSVEKSWDCPCHGARYSCHGKVIEGPATQDLAQLDDIELKIPSPATVSSNSLNLTDPLNLT